MTNSNDDASRDRDASPHGTADEADPVRAAPPDDGPERARDVARLRKAERARLRAERQSLSVAEREAVGQTLAAHLRGLLRDRFEGGRNRVLSLYWPIKGEPDLRPLMAELHGAGVAIALPLWRSRRRR